MLISSQSSIQLKSKISEEKEVFCKGLFLSARWFVLSEVADKGFHLVVLPSKEAAEYCAADLYELVEGDKVFFLPVSGQGVERSNYKATLGVQRTSAITSIIDFDKKDKLIAVTYPEALSEPVPAEVNKELFQIKVGDELSFTTIIEKFSSFGFNKVDFVSSPGEYAVRGSLIDVFSYSFNNPYRISFFGNEVEKIHSFDINSQLSKEEITKIDVVSGALTDTTAGVISLSSIFPKSTIVWLDSSDMYKGMPFFEELKPFKKVYLEVPISSQAESPVSFSISPQPSFNKNFELLTEDLKEKIESGYKVYVYSEKGSQAERLKSIINQNKGILPEFLEGKNIHEGFIDSENRVCCYSDHEIFDRYHRVNIRRTVDKSEQLTLNELSSFNIGDYIVHIDYGVGVFGGLVRMKDDMGRLKEAIKISYKDGDVIFVSVHALNKISRFKSKDGEAPRINKLGSKSWQLLKASTKSRVKDIAKELIELYAKRKASRGYAYSADSYLQQELESSFMYEDTPDQELATVAIKHDMEDSCPMDRLVCGDVGFGKTELAIRAAFKAVCDGKQVAVLVPTTILALQHYNTFSQRLKDLPCKIDYVCRLRSAGQIKEVKKGLSTGSIDIVIGTHKLIGGEFIFKDLGLLIIDEEQKFGVSAKEKLRQLKASVDTLTLTATPIPRTLQFSLLGARDLSIINTPPPNRIPVQTEIILFDEKVIKSILDYELNRGGQIFFLHNKVQELQSIETILSRIEPDMKICIAHGQMEAKELENKVLEFMRGDYDCLLCTTIIENGLDIPNANTILINQAQNIGLSDLHQLRGRVGRSNKRAFCYLIVPPLVGVTDDARRRLKAIEEFSDLGSGFNIAMQDLDIRGAGNLLGAQQSGFIMEMGYETYQKILSEAMEELGVETGHSSFRSNSRQAFVSDCTIETDQQAFIPDNYIDVQAEKLRLYKQIDSFTSDAEINNFSSQIRDRYGIIPYELENLLYILRIRNLGESLGFEKIIIKNGLFICFFISNQMSSYYKSDVFKTVFERINTTVTQFTYKQSDGKYKLVARGVDTLAKAYDLLNLLK